MASSPPFITIRNLRKHYTEGDQQRIIFADLTWTSVEASLLPCLAIRFRQIHPAQPAGRH